MFRSEVMGCRLFSSMASGGTHLAWGQQLRALGGAGAGDRGGPARAWQVGAPGRDAVSAYAAVILGVLDALQLDGRSWSGIRLAAGIAQQFALTYPTAPRGWGLVGTGARLRVCAIPGRGFAAGRVRENGAIGDRLFFRAWLGSRDAAARGGRFSRLRAAGDARDFAACNGFDIMDRVGSIRAPTLISRRARTG